MYIREYPAIPIQYSCVIKCSSLISANSLLGTGLTLAPATLPETLRKKLNELHFLPGILLQSKHTSSLGLSFLSVEILVHALNNTQLWYISATHVTLNESDASESIT